MKYFSLFLLFLLPLLSFGQDKFAYSVSEPYPVTDSRAKVVMIPNQSNFHYKYYLSVEEKEVVLGVKYVPKKGLSIQHFDTKLMKETNRNISPNVPENMLVEHIEELGDKVYCYYSSWDRPNTTEQLFCQEIDIDKCTLIGEPKRLIAINHKLTGVPFAYVDWVLFNLPYKFTFYKSNDETKLLVQTRRRPDKKNDAINHDIIGMYVFDSNHKQLAGNEFKMPYTEQAMDNLDYHLDGDGIPYILARVRPDGSDKNYKGIGAGKTINHHIELLKFDVPNGQIKVTKIDAEGYLLKDIWIFDGPNNNMFCAGFYTLLNKNLLQEGEDRPANSAQGRITDRDDADGIFVFDVKNSGSVNNKNFHEIPLEVINQYERKGTQNRNANKEKKGKAQFEDLRIRSFDVQDDNSIIITGEQFFTEKRVSNGQVYIIYHSEDMLITKIAPDGKLAWMKKLPKRQVSSTPFGMTGFRHLELEGKHYLVFLDNVKNMELGVNKRPAVHIDGKGGYVTAYKVDDATGNVSKLSIFDTKNVKGGYKVTQFNPSKIVKCADDELIIEVNKGQKEDVMIKIKVK